MSKLIVKKQSTRYPGLYVKKYSKKVFYNGLWDTDSALLESRGHVEDEDGNLLVNPFTKIFNHKENGVDIQPEEAVLCVDKINGFLASVTYVHQLDKVLVSTTGSLDSPFVDMAEEYITEDIKALVKMCSLCQPKTYLFEICHPSDPHIVKEQPGASLTGIREVHNPSAYFSTPQLEKSLDITAKSLHVARPGWRLCSFATALNELKSCKKEGYVVYGQESKTVLKLKSGYYLALKAIARKKDIFTLNKTVIDEEFYPLVAFLQSLGEEFSKLNEQERLNLALEYLAETNPGSEDIFNP